MIRAIMHAGPTGAILGVNLSKRPGAAGPRATTLIADVAFREAFAANQTYRLAAMKCLYVNGMVPFARNVSEPRNHWDRPSLTEHSSRVLVIKGNINWPEMQLDYLEDYFGRLGCCTDAVYTFDRQLHRTYTWLFDSWYSGADVAKTHLEKERHTQLRV